MNRISKLIPLLGWILLLLLPAHASADEFSGDWQYALNEEGKAIITGYHGNAQELTLPWHLDMHMIVEIGEAAFADNSTLRAITLPVGVTVIRMEAFRGCTRLQQVTLPELLETIEDGAFAGCTSLSRLRIPEAVAEIGEGCFDASTILTGTENSLAEPYAKACNLQYEPESIPEPEPENTAADYQYRIENGGAVITSYTGEDYEVIVPAELGGYPVRGIGTNAFSSRYGVERVVLPEGLTTLERTAFRYCPALRSIELPSTLRTIGEYAFYRCENLEEVELPAGLTTLGSRAFQGCSSLRRVVIPASVTTIPYYTFFECHAQLTICAPSGSAAERIAYTKGYRFEATE